MQRVRTVGTLGTLAVAAMLLAVALPAGPARAASTVDVTYDLSDTTVEILAFRDLTTVYEVSNDNPVNGTVAGSMKVRYSSDSSSGMPIATGPANLLSLNLTVDFGLNEGRFSGTETPPATAGRYFLDPGSLNWQLGGPITGSLLSGGTLAGLTGPLQLGGSIHCVALTNLGSDVCNAWFGLPPSVTIHPNRTGSGPLALAGTPGAYGGSLSTRHTLTGSSGLPGIAFGAGFGPFFAVSDGRTHNGYGGVQLVGREILREAEGHDPKVIPEPGTLLLLGAGTAGLALVGRVTRGSRRS